MAAVTNPPTTASASSKPPWPTVNTADGLAW